MDLRDRLLDVAETQLGASPDRDVAVRAVCEAAGVGVPMLYRFFGDKNGLLQAVVNRAFERYLRTKRDAVVSDDPVEDLRAGWDSHLAFALEHPTVYQLVYSPAFPTVPTATEEAMALLVEVLERCASTGRLQVEPRIAAQSVMAANVGVALSMITQPGAYDDPSLSRRVRDAVHATVLVLPGICCRAQAEPGQEGEPGAAETLRCAAVCIRAQLRGAPSPALTAEETSLLQQWLARVSAAAETPPPPPEPGPDRP